MSKGTAKRKRPLWVPLGAMAVGLLLFLVAAAGGTDLGLLPPSIQSRGWQLLLSALGIGLLALGVLLLADGQNSQAPPRKRKSGDRAMDYQIKMARPARFHRKMEVVGSYLNQPPDGALRLFTLTEDGRFRPQAVAVFDERSRRWSGTVDLGPGPYYSVYVVAALIDEPGQALWDYFFQVGSQTAWEPIAGRFNLYAWEIDRFLVEGTLYE